MTESDPRREAAALARGLRRYLERERAAGSGELLASSAGAVARAGRLSSVPASSGEPSGVEPGGARDALGAGAPAGELSAAAPIRAREDETGSGAQPALDYDLFGQPEPAAGRAGAGKRGATEPAATPRASTPLNPGGWPEREAIEADSLAVLEQVAREVRACTLCGLCETRSNAVPGVGSARSGIVFVGEAPGAEEDRQGEPFVGRAGELLTRIIKAMDDARLLPGIPLSRESVYICNVLKCRPPENRNPLPHEVESCSPYLQRQLAALKPRLICCLGKFAAELLLGVKGTIAGMRGRTYRFQGAKLIVTYHPAACLRNPNLKRPVWEDMRLLAREYLSE